MAKATMTKLPAPKPDRAYARRPKTDSNLVIFLWRTRMWIESTFAFTVMEQWEKLLVLTIFTVTFFIVMAWLIEALPQRLVLTYHRAIYYLWGHEGNGRIITEWATDGMSGGTRGSGRISRLVSWMGSPLPDTTFPNSSPFAMTASTQATLPFKPKPDLSFTRPPKSKLALLLWRYRMWFEATFVLSMLEPWEKILLLTIFAASVALCTTFGDKRATSGYFGSGLALVFQQARQKAGLDSTKSCDTPKRTLTIRACCRYATLIWMIPYPADPEEDIPVYTTLPVLPGVLRQDALTSFLRLVLGLVPDVCIISDVAADRTTQYSMRISVYIRAEYTMTTRPGYGQLQGGK
ncbi:putative small subunit of serine palmitoyltransferase-like [Lyophyllum shimeji]|uniref:Small subunit of serine palmitoyltransferase-like n=1 Tax=Lyophyllum shimeji TaxID=47721 RepID=A0A9P3UR87_LYOSH|nr:putative small subunit of serine palmitoyltransferase-like [Lyophyllum shimeji]